MKSYTDLEQSKKLAEILPLESADMIWDLANPDLPTIRAIPYEDSDYNNKYYLNIIPAWSLAALLSVITKPDLVQNSEGTWLVHSWVNAYPWSVGGYNNPVDACVAMIEKLHELKML